MFQTWNIPQVLWFPVHLSFGLLLLKDLQQHLIWVFVEHFQLCTAINLSTWHSSQCVLQTASSSPKHASSMPEHTFCKIFSLNRSITLEFQKLVMQSWNIGCFDLGSTESRLHIQLDLEPEHQGMANSALTGRTYIWYNLQQIIAHLLGEVVLEKNIMKLLLFPAAVNIHHSSCLWGLKTKILVSGQHKMHLKHASTCLKQAQAGWSRLKNVPITFCGLRSSISVASSIVLRFSSFEPSYDTSQAERRVPSSIPLAEGQWMTSKYASRADRPVSSTHKTA